MKTLKEIINEVRNSYGDDEPDEQNHAISRNGTELLQRRNGDWQIRRGDGKVIHNGTEKSAKQLWKQLFSPKTGMSNRITPKLKEEVESLDELSDNLLKNYTKKVKDKHDAIVDAEMKMPYNRLNPLKSSRYKGYTRASSILHNRRLNKES